MKKPIFFALCSILVLAFSASAQESERYSSSRLEDLVSQLKRQTVDLADRATEDLRSGNSSRSDIEAAFLAQQLDASAGLFQDFVRDRRRASDLRDGAAILGDLAKRAPNFGSRNSVWRDIQNTVSDINREIGGGFTGGNNSGNNGNNGGNNSGNQASGKAFWRGTVDKEVQLVIRDRNIEIRTIGGASYENATFSFTSSLPTRRVTVEAIKKSGRGSVRVLEQPSRENDYTAIVQILDDDGGAREYQLEIVWR